jgi:hypothetical protein
MGVVALSFESDEELAAHERTGVGRDSHELDRAPSPDDGGAARAHHVVEPP